MIEFGKSLRLAREAKGYTVAQIAELTHMSPTTVSDMEADNVSRIPAPVYGRGFVKLYCEAVGLEAKPFIDEFMAIYTGTHDIGIRERSATPQHPPASAVPESPPEPTPAPEPLAAPEPPPTPAPIVPEPPLPAPAPTPVASEPPPATPFMDQPFLTDAAVPPPPPAEKEPPAFDVDDATASRSLSRYATPVRQPKNEPTVSPAIWRISILGAITLLILWGLILGVQALYRATSGSTSATTEIEPTPPPEEQKPIPAPDAKAAAKTEQKSSKGTTAETAAKPAAPAQKTQRTPQKIPSLYLD